MKESKISPARAVRDVEYVTIWMEKSYLENGNRNNKKHD
jgi:hypothetical protein